MGADRNRSFSPDDSFVIKGVAILMLLWHHTLTMGKIETYAINCFPFTSQQIVEIKTFFKVCVSLFVFVSGYGYHVSFRRKGHMSSNKWVLYRYIRSFMPIWFTILFCWIVSFALNRLPVTVYFSDGIIKGIMHSLFQILGLQKLFGTPTINEAWWYLSACLVYILFSPLLYVSIKKSSVMTLGLVLIIPRSVIGFPGNNNWLTFLLAFCMGMVFAEYDLFGMLDCFMQKSKARRIMITVLYVLLSCLFYIISKNLEVKKYWDIVYGIFPAVYIITLYLTVCKAKILHTILRYIGRHSLNIFIVHPFFQSIYLQDFVYSFKHFAIIYLVLFSLSIVSSILIEQLKRIIRFDDIRKKAISFIE